MRALLLFSISTAILAQTAQSLVPGNTGVGQEWGNTGFVAPAAGTPWVVQVQIDVISTTSMPYDSGIWFLDRASGFYIQQNGCSGLICAGIQMLHETGQIVFQGPFSGTANNYLNFNLIHDSAAGGGSNQDSYEAYDRCGNIVGTVPMTYTSSTSCTVASGGPGTPITVSYATNTANSTDVLAVYGDSSYHIGFIRMCVGAAAVAGLKGHVPLTSGTCPGGSTQYYRLDFDGTVTDTSGTGSCSGACNLSRLDGTGAATYAGTNYLGPVAIIKSLPTPTWSNIISMRAGTSNQLDSTSSYTQALAGSSVTPFWQVTSGPTAPKFSSSTATQPTLSALSFGDYAVQLTETDVSGNSAVSTVDIGAYGSDSNGVIVQSNSIADDLLGPMIAFGKNGWQANDYLAKYTVDAQYTLLNCCTPPTWATPLTGTITYKFGGTGCCSNGTGTTTTGSLTSTALSVPIAQASALDLSNLPTTIWVNDGTTNNTEVMLVTATTATSGAATLTIGYNGRGLYNSGASFSNVAAAHNTSATVGQFRITGSSTKFVSDGVQATCPAAASASLPSPTGIPIYSTGTVTLAASSTTMTGSGTTWNNANGIFTHNLQAVLVKATHASGTAFSFISWIADSGLISTTSITLGTAAPSDVDTSTPFSYYILNPIYPVLEYTRQQPADGSTGRTYQNGLQICLGDTQMGGVIAHDYGATTNNHTMSAQNYSYQASVGPSPSSTFQPAFYGTSLAAASFYLRSGYKKAHDLWTFIESYLSPSPGFDSGYTGVFTVTQNAAPLGGYLNLKVDPNTTLTVSSLRGYGNTAVALPTQGCSDDPRDDGVKRQILALGALYDSGYSSLPTYGTFLAGLKAVYTGHDVGGTACKQTDNSFSNTTLIGTPVLAGLSMTNNSTAVTGSGITSPMCTTVASGTVTVSNNDVLVSSHSGTGFSGASSCTANCQYRIIIQQNGGAYVTAFSFIYTSSTTLTLNGYWPGTTCTSGSPCSYTIDSFVPTVFGDSSMEHIGASGFYYNLDSANLSKVYSCAYVSPTQMTIFPAWSGASSGPTYSMYNNGANGSNTGSYPGIGGYESQPFMLGGFTELSLSFAALADNSNAWGTLRDNVSNFMWSPPSYDPNNFGVQYAVNCGGCDQKRPYNSGQGFVWGGTSAANSESWVQSDATPVGGTDTARGVAVEPLNSLTVAFKAGFITQTFGDHVYGAQWSNLAYAPNSGGFYTPGDNLSASNCQPNSGSLGYWKWPGFCFGIGMSHQWPAARLGGVAPADPFTITQPCIALYAGTASCSLAITAPNGVVSTVTCAVNTSCSTTIDRRQGAVYVKKQWINVSAIVLGTSPGFIIKPS